MAIRAQQVEISAQSNSRNGKTWHNDFAETDLEEVIDTLKKAANALGLSADSALLDEDTPRQFPVNELPDYVEALAADSSGRDIAHFVDTLSLRIRGLLAPGRLSSVLKPEDSASITLKDWLTDYVGADSSAKWSDRSGRPFSCSVRSNSCRRGVVAPLLAEREIYLWWWPR